ncbi:hypothetical protein quinque_002992 [Culex quinquefasciatus]
MMSALTRLIFHLLGDPLLEYQHDDNQKIDPVKEWKHKVSQEEDEEAGEPEEEGSDEKDTESGKSAAKEQVDPEKVFQCTVDTDGRAQERAAEAKRFIRNLPVYPMTVKNSGLIIEHLQDLRSAKRFLKKLFVSKPYIYDGVKLMKLEHKPLAECPAAEAQRGGRSGKVQVRGRMKRKSNAKSESREAKVSEEQSRLLLRPPSTPSLPTTTSSWSNIRRVRTNLTKVFYQHLLVSMVKDIDMYPLHGVYIGKF